MMTRTLTVLAVGVLLGAVATLLLRPSTPALPELGDLPLPPPSTTAAEPVVSTAAREGGPDFYRRLSEASAGELATMVAQAAAEPASTDRELALAVLLKRYSEIDAVGAVRLAREARVGGMALSTAYGAWARQAPSQALAALGTVESPDAAADIAFALIAAFGNDTAAVARVAAVLVERDEATPFGTAPLIAPAMTPVGPFPAGAPRSALTLTAERWAALDPRHALAVARELDDERARVIFASAALRALARRAPGEAFDHFAALGPELAQPVLLNGALADLARADPARLLSAASGLPTDLRRVAESTALRQLAEQDPLAAVRYIERMPAGMERQALTQIVARSYGMRDAAAALAWARAQPGPQNLVAAVIGGIAERDPNRAVDLALELRSPLERMQALQIAVMTGARQDATVETIANRLLAQDDPSVQSALMHSVIPLWASRSPDGAMNWLLANGRNAHANVFMQVGQQLAFRNPDAAVGYTSQVPSVAREPWIQGVAQGYAQNDAQRAIEWLDQYRGEPWYDRTAATIAMGVAHRDGAAAARIIDGLDPARMGPQARDLANAIASGWATQDPAAAAEWAMDRSAEQERTMAVHSVVGVWSNQDADAARQWTLQLPQGALRDGALTTLLTATAHDVSQGLDARVLGAFASDGARQQAVVQVVQSLAFIDAARARAIADTHLTEAAYRAQAERAIEAARNGSGPAQIGFGVSQGVLPTNAIRVR